MEIKIYPFGVSTSYPEEPTKKLLGGKGYSLKVMGDLGVAVPPGFTIPPSLCKEFSTFDESKVQSLRQSIKEGMQILTDHFGRDVLVSVRSGAAVSLPGMCDTILNVGLHKSNLAYWSGIIGEECAFESYARLVLMYSDVVLGLGKVLFGEKEGRDAQEWAFHVDTMYKNLMGVEFPHPEDQLVKATIAVFKSWDNPRAIEYRNIHGISHDLGTAATIQSMVFGNYNDQSCTGVVFTRCPNTGEKHLVGEFLPNAQGEDIVAGIKTPNSIAEMEIWDTGTFSELKHQLDLLESHFKDMQDVRVLPLKITNYTFYKQETGKRTANAAIQIALDLHKEGMITATEALKRVTIKDYFKATAKVISPKFKVACNAVGIPASPGVVTGKVIFSSKSAHMCTEPFILVMKETTPDEIGAINKSVGMLTAIGGLSSHSAVVARAMGKVCVVGCTDLTFTDSVKLGDLDLKEGDTITIDGTTGKIWVNTKVPLVDGSVNPNLEALQNLVVKDYVEICTDSQDSDLIEGDCIYVPLDLNNVTPEKVTEAFTRLSSRVSGKIYVSLLEGMAFIDSTDRDVFTTLGDTKTPKICFDLMDQILTQTEVNSKVIYVSLIEEGISVEGVLLSNSDSLGFRSRLVYNPSSVVTRLLELLVKAGEVKTVFKIGGKYENVGDLFKKACTKERAFIESLGS